MVGEYYASSKNRKGAMSTANPESDKAGLQRHGARGKAHQGHNVPSCP